jgi:hypothetical protein
VWEGNSEEFYVFETETEEEPSAMVGISWILKNSA